MAVSSEKSLDIIFESKEWAGGQNGIISKPFGLCK